VTYRSAPKGARETPACKMCYAGREAAYTCRARFRSEQYMRQASLCFAARKDATSAACRIPLDVSFGAGSFCSWPCMRRSTFQSVSPWRTKTSRAGSHIWATFLRCLYMNKAMYCSVALDLHGASSNTVCRRHCASHSALKTLTNSDELLQRRIYVPAGPVLLFVFREALAEACQRPPLS
jgi:hypothetical protein